MFSNSDLSAGFDWTEVGIFISNPNSTDAEPLEDVLYAYSHYQMDGDESGAAKIPAKGDEIFEVRLTYRIYVGEVDNISAQFSDALSYVTKQELNSHADDRSNPHQVTAAQVGLGNVDNVAVDDMAPSIAEEPEYKTIEEGDTLPTILGKIRKLFTKFTLHLSTDNPHGITYSNIGAASSTHKHSTSDITSGTLSVARGGTGSSTAANAANAILASGASSIGGNLWFSQIGNSGTRGIGGDMSTSDYWRVVGRSETQDNGYVEIATGDNGTNPIVVRQYPDKSFDNGKWYKPSRTAYLLDTDGNTSFPGNCTAEAYNTYSDKKMKNIHCGISEDVARELVMGLNPVEYDLKSDKSHHVKLGFVAQEVYSLARKSGYTNCSIYAAGSMPKSEGDVDFKAFLTDEEIDSIGDDELRWSVDYLQLIAPLVRLVQSQEERINELEKILKERGVE
jgi:hypothetical protein